MFIAVFAIAGLIIGSAINAIVWRLYVGKSWVCGHSMCPDCEHRLAAKDLVPVASWLVLKGHCRYCKAKIHWQYPTVELLTAGLFGLSAAALAPDSTKSYVLFVIWLWLLVQLIILAVYDLRWMLLPDKVVLPAIGVAMFQLLLLVSWGEPYHVWLGPLVAAAAAGGAFWILATVANGRLMGGGDVKLVFLMGLILGLQRTGLALFIGFDTAALVGVILIFLRRRKRTDYLPFGPFLIAGTVVAFLYGTSIIHWYLNLNGIL
jgi:prepilin signal peptidase PulO-like enzyme (type II secretory pathway)